MKVLVTGGAGYIGSHTCLQLLRSGHDIHVVDNLFTGKIEALTRVQRLSNRKFEFSKCDIRNSKTLDGIFADFRPEAVIHFAGLKSVTESVKQPASYYSVNVGGTAALLDAMNMRNCGKIVFSSSATIYGIPQYLPCDEDHPVRPITPYGRSKLVGEQLLQDWSIASANRHAIALRYFNPVGADISGVIGEDPNGIPTNLMPIISQVAIGRREYLQVYGDDYQTKDGTGVRDFVHVHDLALAHVLAVDRPYNQKNFEAFNIGTGRGTSVIELVHEFERQSGRKIPIQIAPRRTGDAAEVWADVSKASLELNFRSKLGIEQMCRDAWRWQASNPNGYDDQ